MRKITAKILISIAILIFGASVFVVFLCAVKTENVLATPFVKQTKKIKILIVPGHEPNTGGASYRKINERDLNLQLSEILKNNLSKNTNIEVTLARDKNGWNSDLKNYVETGSTTIMSWATDTKNKMLAKVNARTIKLINPDIKHNSATYKATLYLYGTNKWINENNIDLVLHIHFNDNPKYKGKPNYSGYCMYISDSQYGNASSSRIFANYLNDEISKIKKASNMPQEKKTIIPGQQLIAIGNYDTLKIPSVVLEYAYIYEPIMTSSSTRNIFINKAALSTATAIKKYVENQF